MTRRRKVFELALAKRSSPSSRSGRAPVESMICIAPREVLPDSLAGGIEDRGRRIGATARRSALGHGQGVVNL